MNMLQSIALHQKSICTNNTDMFDVCGQINDIRGVIEKFDSFSDTEKSTDFK